jgi:hypothetical protein
MYHVVLRESGLSGTYKKMTSVGNRIQESCEQQGFSQDNPSVRSQFHFLFTTITSSRRYDSLFCFQVLEAHNPHCGTCVLLIYRSGPTGMQKHW